MYILKIPSWIKAQVPLKTTLKKKKKAIMEQTHKLKNKIKSHFML